MTDPVTAKYAKHVNPAFVDLLGTFGYGRVFVRGEGCFLVDDQGRRYLDALAGFGATNLGHNHPKLLTRVRDFLDSGLPNLVHTGPQPLAADLAERLSQRSGLEVALFTSSGAEAVEAGMKVARAATGRAGFLSCEGGFHGTNLGTLSIMHGKRWRGPFEPLLAGCERVPFGDLAAASKALATKRFAAFVVEPILGEGGVIVPPAGWLAEVAAACKASGTLLVVDEVQTGMGRTGTLFAVQPSGVVPDVLVLAKSLGGGLVPIGAALVSADLHQRAYGKPDRFDLHSSTFAGNALACACALATLDILDEEQLIANAERRGRQLCDGLRTRLAGHPLVREVRGAGLLVGIELGPATDSFASRLSAPLVRTVAREVFGQWLALRLLEAGIVAQPASQQWDVLRLEPPLTIDEAGITAIIDAVGAILDEYRSTPPVLADVAKRLGEQWRRGWTFR